MLLRGLRPNSFCFLPELEPTVMHAVCIDIDLNV
jgi:hypothetical protein